MEIGHIPGTFHGNVKKDFKTKTIILGNMVESWHKKIESIVRVEKRWFVFFSLKNVFSSHRSAGHLP